MSSRRPVPVPPLPGAPASGPAAGASRDLARRIRASRVLTPALRRYWLAVLPAPGAGRPGTPGGHPAPGRARGTREGTGTAGRDPPVAGLPGLEGPGRAPGRLRPPGPLPGPLESVPRLPQAAGAGAVVELVARRAAPAAADEQTAVFLEAPPRLGLAAGWRLGGAGWAVAPLYGRWPAPGAVLPTERLTSWLLAVAGALFPPLPGSLADAPCRPTAARLDPGGGPGGASHTPARPGRWGARGQAPLPPARRRAGAARLPGHPAPSLR